MWVCRVTGRCLTTRSGSSVLSLFTKTEGAPAPPSFSHFTALLPQALVWLCLELLYRNTLVPSSPEELPIHCSPCYGAGWHQPCLALHPAVNSFSLWWTGWGSLIKRCWDVGMLQPKLSKVLCTDDTIQLPWCLHTMKSLPSLWDWGYQVSRCFFFLLVNTARRDGFNLRLVAASVEKDPVEHVSF